MNHLLRSLLLIAMLSCSGLAHSPAMAQEQAPPAPPAPPAEKAEGFQLELDRERDRNDVERELHEAERALDEFEAQMERRWGPRDYSRDNVVINIGADSSLPANERADAVVAIFGSASSAGDVYEAVVAVGGNARATGTVGEGVVAVLGDVFVDGRVAGDVVAAFGNVTLGPNAIVGGEVAAVGGVITRDPKATVHGPQHQVAFGSGFARLEGLRPWFERCLLYGRPLAFDKDVAWAWWVAFGFLGLYVLIALLFDNSVQRCVTTLEERPLQSVVASILTVLVSPVMMLLLAITIIGIALVPFLAIGLFCAALFGKAVVLAALGRRITRFTGVAPLGHVAFATFVGGLLLMIMYVVPVLGFIAYNVVGFLGLGAVAYTLILALHTNNGDAVPAAATATAAPTASTVDPIPTAGVADGHAVPPPAATEPPPANPTNIELNALPRAGFWIRMGALLIDAILVGVLVHLLEPSGNFPLLVLAGYGALMWKLKGTTIGGIICNLRVVRTDGRDIEWETAIVRALSCFLSLIPAGLGFVWMVFDNNRQTWHDKIAGTVVVRC